MDGYKVEAVKCDGHNCYSEIITGTWSPIYTQLLSIQLDNGMRLVSNFRYNLKPSISENPLGEDVEKFKNLIHKAGHASFQYFDFQCQETMVGNVQMWKEDQSDSMKNFRVQCFYGKQILKYDVERSELIEKGSDLQENKITSRNPEASLGVQTALKKVKINKSLHQNKTHKHKKDSLILSQVEQSLSISTDMNDAFRASDDTDLMINSINDDEYGVRANTCMLQKSNSRYGEGKNCEQSLFMIDQSLAKDEKKFGDSNDDSFKKALEYAQQWQKKYSDAQDIPDDEIPDTHDFRNIMGYDFTSEHLNQGHCGSCYTVAFTQAVNARLRLRYGKDIESVAPQQMLQCNFLQEGCKGGQPILDAFFYE